MSLLTDEARNIIEKNYDSFLEIPSEIEVAYRNALRAHKIEPNLETVLSYATGFISGVVWNHYLHRENREMTYEEIHSMIDLMKRRAWELRQAFIETRIE